MLATYCDTIDCKEYGVAKEVPDDLKDDPIMCGTCGHDCVIPEATDAEPGEIIV